MNHLAHRVERPPAHPRAIELQPEASAVEKPQHRFLPVHGRVGGAAQVEPLIADRRAEPAVLREPVLRDVHPRQHLDAGHDRWSELLRQHGDVAERAVDAEPHVELVRAPLEVNVAGAVRRGAGDDAFEHQHGGFLGRFVPLEQLRRGGIDDDRPGIFLADVGHPLVAVVAVQRGDDLVLEREHRLDLAAGREAQIVERGQVFRHRERDDERGSRLLQGECGVPPGDFFRKRRDRLGADRVGVDPRRRHAELLAQHFEKHFRRQHAAVDEHPPEPPPGALLLVDRDLELRLRDEPAVDEQAPERRVPSRRVWWPA